MSQDFMKSILPFAIKSQDGKETFSENKEIAAIFCLADQERTKGGGIIFKQPPEKLAFIAKVCYPFWFIEIEEIDFLFDGLNTESHTLTYQTMPSSQVFLDNMEKSSKTWQAFIAFLSDNINYFKVADEKQKKTISGLITNPEFLDDFNQYLVEAKPMENALPSVVQITPTLDEQSILSNISELQNLKSGFSKQVNNFHRSMKLINKYTKNLKNIIHNQIEKIKEEFNQKIEAFSVEVEGDVDRIHKEYDNRLTTCSKEMEELLFGMEKERIKLRKMMKQLAEDVKHCEAEIKTSAIDKDNVGEQKWKDEKNQLKSQLSDIEPKIKKLAEEIAETKEQKNLKEFELKQECEAKVKEAKKDLLEIEASRDAKIKILEEKMEKLEDLSSNLIENLGELTTLREKSIDEFQKLGIPKDSAPRTLGLVYMPFYLVCYQSDSETRFVTFPPSTVSNVGILGKIKSPPITKLLQPRSKMLASLLDKFPLILEQDSLFKRELNKACKKTNLLTESSIELIKEGLEQLKEKGWLSEKNCASLYQNLM